MNKSYRVIWNYALQCYVVTSELARGKVKSSCSGKAANKSALIGGALGSALLLAGSPAALAANGATISDPAQPVELNNQTLQATGDKAYGLLVQNGGKASATDVTVLNAGSSGYGVFSTAGAASAEMTRGSVTTTGAGGYGIVASLTGAVKTNGTKVETSGQNAYAAYASSGGIINSTDTDYVTHGDGAYGAYSRAAGSLIDLTGGSVTTSGNKAYGLVAGNGSKLNASGVQVTTSGDQSSGVVANNAGTEATLMGGTVNTTGSKAVGLAANSGGKLNASDVQVSTTGANAYGAYAASGARLSISGTKLITSGNDADGVYTSGEGSLLNVSDSTVAISGNGSNGLKADGKSTLNATNSAIEITGDGSGTYASGTGTVLNLSDSHIYMGQNAENAARGMYNSTTNLKNVEIITDASNAALAAAFGATLNSDNVNVQARSGGFGIEVQDGSTFRGNNITIQKSGTDSEGFNAAINMTDLYYPDARNTLSLSDSDINVSGENATGILSRRQATLADIKLANTAITATDGTAVNVLTGTDIKIDADNSVLSGSTLLKTGYDTVEGSTAGSVVLNGSNHSLFEGNVDIDRSQTQDSQINLSGSSVWTGASSGLNTLTLSDNSQWNITGDSSVDALSASNSTLNFTHDGAGFSTLTVNGNYIGDNSTLVMNAALGDDNSATDKLHILGDSSGSTDVVVNNAGGSGAQTIQGLNIIQVDGANNGEFRQKGRIVAGAYDYNLVKGADQHGWYLVSDRNGSEPDPVVTPGEGEGGEVVEPPVSQHDMIVRPEAASYSANLAAANTLFTTSMDDRPAETVYTDASGQRQSTRLWLHNSAGHSRVKDDSGQLKSDTNRYAIQLGGDVASGTLTGSDSLRLGAMAGYGNAQSKSRSAVSGYQSRGQVNGYSLGVYGSWLQNAAEQSGAFVDSSLSYGWFNNSVKGDDIGQQSYKSKGIGASLASGYRAQVATLSDSTSLWLRPQAQLNWQGVKADDVKEQNGSRVQATGQDNLQSRLGVRASLRALLDPQSQSAIEPYAEANWLHNSRAFGTALNGVNIQQAGTRNAAEVKLGVDARLNANVNLWGGVAQQLGNHSYSDTSAVAGVKVSF
ncbi:autotransporter outer membrane beta-barrel domain-containing protein [Pantoea dispersa]|uniref:autotransporter outer membrane beta-barrel domain-containing protein n=1 Tax=Pantoea dispersa TaxID=59814 RepID=UPI0024AF7813|nr:autotransporter outer membrane beta-barrel domain-containing protein [Pantoea dispersa]MDI6633840.1 autotransporter outer membrane beta-barrel domain-containing protein [Pantoea dispersa]